MMSILKVGASFDTYIVSCQVAIYYMSYMYVGFHYLNTVPTVPIKFSIYTVQILSF